MSYIYDFEPQTETEIRVVREKNQAPDFLYSLVPYYKRKDLTSGEKVEIGNYQDIHPWNVQKDWSIPIPESWKEKRDCYVLNSFSRFPDFSQSLSAGEIKIISDRTLKIDSAIGKSRWKDERFIYRGVFDDSWLLNPSVGSIFTEKAFGSFSLAPHQAYNYMNPEFPILFQLRLTKGMNALYIDDTEYEILRPRNSIYEIIKIFKEKRQITPNLYREVLIYNIEEVKTEEE
ncbi:hypothetical protein MmiHf6_11400 [Methanimicrococcus hongohii]|uniref:ADP ribosyltransferase domain-containing protein n=1 Tax=Methanimicrococcus hongohii TaxID=3028295 RepID=A0AA96V035_9EURY|nr:ADP-ribosyltransferase [Methanimicrococcus sp. Hf6]WNY23819.1 hypothetical protein MmiHf6_11400 [Methanimicrococcus sp. Hf6]